MSHYYSETQTSDLKLTKIKTRLKDKEIEFYSGSGVFSKSKVDKGTELLVNNCIVKDKWEILDLGCGYGVIGVTLAKTTKANITMTDINKRAVKLTKMNLKLNDVKAKVLQGDLYEPVLNMKFDTILTNPPYSAGRKICSQIITESKSYLKKKGLLQLVARHQKGGKTLSKKMEELFGNVKEVAKGSGYRVYVSQND